MQDQPPRLLPEKVAVQRLPLRSVQSDSGDHQRPRDALLRVAKSVREGRITPAASKNAAAAVDSKTAPGGHGHARAYEPSAKLTAAGIVATLSKASVASDRAYTYSHTVAKQAELLEHDPLWAAVGRGKLVAVRAEVARGAPNLLARGVAGETLLHIAYLHCSPAHKDVAHFLLDECPELLELPYAGTAYTGENVLHLSIAHADVPEAQRLLRAAHARGVLPQMLAHETTGTFFAPSNKDTYFGGFPLSFAAGMNVADVVYELVHEYGADIAAADSFKGNTVAHICVLHNRIAMYDLVEALWNAGYGRPKRYEKTPLGHLCNLEGMSPIVLAAAVGHREMFDHLWAKNREKLWQWGHITAWTLPLDHIDSVGTLIPVRDAVSTAVSTAASSPPSEPADSASPVAVAENPLQDASNVRSGEPVSESAASPRSPPPVATSSDAAPPLPVRIDTNGVKPSARSLSIKVPTTPRTPGAPSTSMRRTYSVAVSTPRTRPAGDDAAPDAEEPIQYVQQAPTALDMVVRHDHETILMSEPMLELLELKWQKFGRHIFYAQLFFIAAFLLTFTAMAALRTHMPGDRRFLQCPTDVPDEVCRGTLTCESLVIVFTSLMVVLDVRRMHRWGIIAYFSKVKGAGSWNHILSVLLWSASVVAIAIDARHGASTSRVPFSIASIICWSTLLWFLLGFRLTGPFVIVLHRMVTEDLVRFVMLLAIVMLGFTHAFLFLIDFDADAADVGAATVAAQRFAQILRLLFETLIQPTLNDPQDDRYLLLPTIIYCFIAPIVLLTLLIGMFDHSVSKIISSSEHRWQLERARMLLCMEGDTPDWIRRLPALSYWEIHHDRPHFIKQETNKNLLASSARDAAAQACIARVTIERRLGRSTRITLGTSPSSAVSTMPRGPPVFAVMESIPEPEDAQHE